MNVALLIFPGVQTLDFIGPFEFFKTAPNWEVQLVGLTRDPIRSITGLDFTPDCALEDAGDVDVFCIPGGGGVYPLLNDLDLLDSVRAQARRSRYVTSVCTGALILGAAGLLLGRRASTHWAAMACLPKFGAIAVRERVVRDGNVITAGGVTAGMDFGLEIISILTSNEIAETVQLTLEYDPHPPFSAGSPVGAPPERIARILRSNLSLETNEMIDLAASRLGLTDTPLLLP